MAEDYFKKNQLDVLARLNVIYTLLQSSGNIVNPVFNTFSGSWIVPDARPSGKKAPQDYRSVSSVIEFNDMANFDGVPFHNNGYGYVMTVAGYNSNGAGGGGFPVQLAFADSLAVRRGNSATTWTPWKRVASYDDTNAQFGSSVATDQKLIVGGDVSSRGASLLVQCGGTTVMGVGNKSALLGGAYDGTPFIFSPTMISTYSGFNFGGPVWMKGGAELVRLKDDQSYISFISSTTNSRMGYIQALNGASFEIAADTNHILKLTTNGAVKYIIDTAGNFYPAYDGLLYAGLPQNRFSALYAVTGAIQVSDARKKTSVTELTPAMRAAAREMLPIIGTYQWLDSVKEKGADKARLHVGFTVQQAISILEKHGIDPFSVAFICHDEWPAEYENRLVNAGEKVTKMRIVQKQKTRTVKQPQDVVELINGKPVLVRKVVDVTEPVFDELPVLHEDGSPVMLDEHTPMLHRVPVMETVQEPYEADAEPKYEKVLVRDAGDCFAFRYDQLTLFMLSALAE